MGPVNSSFFRPWVAAILVAVTLLMRFIMLGDRPVMHDESMFAYNAYIFSETGRYTHLPILHGPTLMLATGTLFTIFGDSITVARALIAVASLVMLAAALVLVPRRYRLGFAPLLITSPALLYYSRFLRDDILFSAVLMVGMAALAVTLSRRRGPGVMMRAACAALGMFMFVALAGIMENAAFIYATGATFLLLWTAQRRWWDGWRGWHGRHGNAALCPTGNASLHSTGRWFVGAGWALGLVLGLAYLAFVYGITLGPSFQDEARRAAAGDATEALRAIYLKQLNLTEPRQPEVTLRLMADSWRNVKESWDYWMGQHKGHRISGPSHYYLPILLTYELPICLLLVAGLLWDACLRRRRAAVYAAGTATWVAFWLLWMLVSANFAPAVELERFLHLAPDASALTLGLIITPVLVWSLLSLREHRALAAWMGWWLACSLFQYSSAGEKVPWLAVHIALPLHLTVIWLWAPLLRRLGRPGEMGRLREIGRLSGTGKNVAIGIVAPLFVVGASLLALRNDIPLIDSRSADPAERIVYNHTTPWLHQALMSRAASWTAMQDTVPLKRRRVVMTGDGVWPAVWYLRHFSYQLVDENQKFVTVPEDTALIIGTPERLAPLRVAAPPGRFIAHEGSLRDGWIQTSPFGEGGPDLLGSGMAKLWRYYRAREPWTPRSGFPILLLEPVPARH